MANQTMTRFGHPETQVQEYQHWTILLRPQQVTLGSLVLCSKSDVTAFSELPAAAFVEFETVVKDIERVLSSVVDFDKINYLMFMMIDPNVHFHVIPRYAGERSFDEITIVDDGWPLAPKLDAFHELTTVERDSLRQHISALW